MNLTNADISNRCIFLSKNVVNFAKILLSFFSTFFETGGSQPGRNFMSSGEEFPLYY